MPTPKLPGKIRAAKSIDEKIQLAAFGRPISPLEQSALEFLNLPKDIPQNIYDQVSRRLLDNCRAALLRRDSSVFRGVAKLLKQKFIIADPTRSKLLRWKQVGEGDFPPTDKRWAALVGYTGDMDTFRRILRAIPLAYKKVPGGRPKIDGRKSKKQCDTSVPK
jgi:hypothetical protein